MLLQLLFLLWSSGASGLRSFDGAKRKVITCVDTAGDWRANSGCFFFVKFRTRLSCDLEPLSSAASILVRRESLALFAGSMWVKLDTDNERMGDSCAMAGLTAKFCE